MLFSTVPSNFTNLCTPVQGVTMHHSHENTSWNNTFKWFT